MRGNLPLTNRLLSILVLLAVFAACADEVPVTSPPEVVDEEVTQPSSNLGALIAATCVANVKEGELTCGDVPVVDDDPVDGPQRVILGGQGAFVQLVSTNVSYDMGTQIFQADVLVQNLIPQGLGSADGLTITGIQVFHHTGPTVTASTGPGSVTVANADGTGTFTGANQPYFEYFTWVPGPMFPFIFQTFNKTWQWNVPTTVTTFVFEVFVSADVMNPDGFVSMNPTAALMSVGGGTVTVTGTPVDVVGRPVAGTVTYTSNDPSIASVDLNTGVITAVSSGVVDIVGSTGGPESDGITRVTVDPPTAGFNINLYYLTPVSPSRQAIFASAAARWEGLITADLPTERVTIPFLACGTLVDEFVDDVAINVVLGTIDGPGGILGQASFCWVRAATTLPAFGFMQFDVDDIAALEANGQFDDVVLHEMGHVLGVGSLWDQLGLLADNTGPLDDCFPTNDDPPPPLTTDPYFTGPLALAAFNSNGGATYVGNKVPVENDFGPGTRCVHWRESVADDELMTGFTEPAPTVMPLSELTVKSMADMGYAMAASGWDSWTCPACAPPAPGAPIVDARAGGFQLVDDIWLGPAFSRDEQGQIIVVRPDRRR